MTTAYCGQTTRNSPTDRALRKHRIGECTIRGGLPPRATPWIFDNGAWGDWKAGRPFPLTEWHRDVCSIVHGEAKGKPIATRPDFVVAPDAVGDGAASLPLSLATLPFLQGAGLQAYLAVQDGMTERDVELALAKGFAGIFVGGSTPWKLATAAVWVRLAHRLELRCHIGRVGTARRVRWAVEIGADSIDSCQPLWSREHLRRFVDALRLSPDQGLFWRNTESGL